MNAYGYYLVDVDGITLVEFGEENTTWVMCDMEGGKALRYAAVED